MMQGIYNAVINYALNGFGSQFGVKIIGAVPRDIIAGSYFEHPDYNESLVIQFSARHERHQFGKILEEMILKVDDYIIDDKLCTEFNLAFQRMIFVDQLTTHEYLNHQYEMKEFRYRDALQIVHQAKIVLVNDNWHSDENGPQPYFDVNQIAFDGQVFMCDFVDGDSHQLMQNILLHRFTIINNYENNEIVIDKARHLLELGWINQEIITATTETPVPAVEQFDPTLQQQQPNNPYTGVLPTIEEVQEQQIAMAQALQDQIQAILFEEEQQRIEAHRIRAEAEQALAQRIAEERLKAQRQRAIMREEELDRLHELKNRLAEILQLDEEGKLRYKSPLREPIGVNQIPEAMTQDDLVNMGYGTDGWQ